MSLPIHNASGDGNLAEVKRLVEEEGVNPEEPNPSSLNATPLQCASFHGSGNVATYLLETCGVHVDQVGDNNWTALLYAAKENHVGCVSLLLQHGADPDMAETIDGFTPLMLSAECGHLASMTLLLQDGRCSLEIKSRDTRSTAILLAADQKKWDCVEVLLSYHASPTATDDDGWNLQDYAVHCQAPPQTLQLIQAAIAEPQRTFSLAKARHLSDTNHAISKAKTKALKEARTRSETLSRVLAKTPPYLKKRVKERQVEVPRVELRQQPQDNENENDEEGEKQMVAVMKYVLRDQAEYGEMGGMSADVFVELLEMMAPKWDAIKGDGGGEGGH